jgi:hypothetical protein
MGAASGGGVSRSRVVDCGDDLTTGVPCRGHCGRYSMEVLACIPELPCPAGAIGPAVVLEASCLNLVAATPTPPPESAVECVPASVVSPSPAPRSDTGWQSKATRTKATRFFSPSIIALMALATVVWAAAWRNDQLRLEAARQQRPERMAQELPPTAGANRSVAP